MWIIFELEIVMILKMLKGIHNVLNGRNINYVLKVYISIFDWEIRIYYINNNNICCGLSTLSEENKC